MKPFFRRRLPVPWAKRRPRCEADHGDLSAPPTITRTGILPRGWKAGPFTRGLTCRDQVTATDVTCM